MSEMKNILNVIRKHNFGFINPKNYYNVDHKIRSIDDALDLNSKYDVFLFEEGSKVLRDLVLFKGHFEDDPRFEKMSGISEVVSDSSIMKFLYSGCVYKDIFPVTKMVRLWGYNGNTYTLRFNKDMFQAFMYDEKNQKMIDVTSDIDGGNKGRIVSRISYEYRFLEGMIDIILLANFNEKRIKSYYSSVLFFGDSMGSCLKAKLSDCDFALVGKDYKPYSGQ